MAGVFERMYNTLVNTRSYDPHCISYIQCEFDIYKLHIWELFVCTTAYMLHNGMYKAIHDLLYHTYFLNSDPMGTQLLEKSYTALRFWSEMLEEIIKPKLSGDLPRKYTLTGHLICTEREYFPIFTADAIANADLFLYQVYNGMDLECFQYDYAWFPSMYIYAKQSSSIWKRVKSRRFCIEIAKLFGVETIKELKDRLSKCVHDSDIHYNLGGPSAPAIMDIIDIGEIGVLP